MRRIARGALLGLSLPTVVRAGGAQVAPAPPVEIPPVLPLPGEPTAAERALLRRRPEIERQLLHTVDAARPVVVVFDTTLRRPDAGAAARWAPGERDAVLARARAAGADARGHFVRPVHLRDVRANASVALDAPWGGAGALVVRPGEVPRLLPASAVRRCDRACWRTLVGPPPARGRRTA